jgi:uncharacterized UBP type Zn finger protein
MRFTNPGAACYLNAAVQFLLQVVNVDWGRSEMGQLLNELTKMKVSSPTAVIPVWEAINKLVSSEQRYNGRQGDAHEMFVEILNVLQNDAMVNNLFGIRFMKTTQCLACTHMSKREETANQLTVGGEMRDLGNFFQSYFTPEKIDRYECERCTASAPDVRTMAEMFDRVNYWPAYLMIYIARFNGNSKVTSPFKFSLVFVGTKPTDPEYALDALVLHSGATRQSGHYVTLGRADQGSFIKYNDDAEPVQIPQADVVKQIFQEQVYMLLYRRCSRKN